MKLIKVFLLVLTVLILLPSLMLVVSSHFKYSFYRKLTEEINNKITNKSYGYLETINDADRKRNINYYYDDKIVAIDNYGEGEKLIRRDFYSDSVKRVSFYYNEHDKIYYREYYDKDKKLINSGTVFIPYIRGGGMYW